MKSALEEIGVLFIHLKTLMDMQDRMLNQAVEHLLPILEERTKEKEDEVKETADEVLYERLKELDEMINPRTWRIPTTTDHGLYGEEDEEDAGRNHRDPRKEDEFEFEARSDGKSSEDGRRLFSMVVKNQNRLLGGDRK